jgi:hypothetical protein
MLYIVAAIDHRCVTVFNSNLPSYAASLLPYHSARMERRRQRQPTSGVGVGVGVDVSSDGDTSKDIAYGT